MSGFACGTASNMPGVRGADKSRRIATRGPCGEIRPGLDTGARMAVDSHGTATLDVWSDFVCPFCWLAEPVVDEAGRILDISVRRRGYELRPLPAPMPEPRYLRRLWDVGVVPIARSLGIDAAFPTVFPRTRGAHEAVAFARAQGRADEMRRALFEAYFVRGQDIGRTEVLARVADRVGLDAYSLDVALDNEACADAVREEARTARALSIRALPAFVLHREDDVIVRTGWCDLADLTDWCKQTLEMERA